MVSPLLVLIALLIKATDRGPVFYRGERVGLGGRIFRIYKFRTLAEGAEAKIGARLLRPEDRRLYYTPIGRLLKRSKLDELPQLLNVLRSEMRLVGPRPLRPIFLEQLTREIPNYWSRFEVPPGITGIAQLRGGYYTPERSKLRYDLIYIKNRSVFLDTKVVLFTLIKVLDRWLSAGVFVLFLFLLVSFVPTTLPLLEYVSAFGFKIRVVYVAIIVVAAGMLVRRFLSQLTFYRCPMNLPTVLFVVMSIVGAALSQEPYMALRGSGYYVITGFLVSFLILNSLGTKEFVTLTIRVVALTPVVISLLSLLRLFTFNYALTEGAFRTVPTQVDPYSRVSSVLEDPAVLASYLVLGVPLLLYEVARSGSRTARDFWLVCTTISFVGIVFTQSIPGLLALGVSGTMFCWRWLNRRKTFVAVCFACLVSVVAVATPRLSLEWRGVRGIENAPVKALLVGAGAAMTLREHRALGVEGRATPARGGATVGHRNMHLTLLREHGVIGWLIVMWLIVSALLVMNRVQERIRDPDLGTAVRAITASIVGFLISMHGINAFHNLTIQFFFWSLIGIGFAIVIRLHGDRRQNLIWPFGEAGD